MFRQSVITKCLRQRIFESNVSNSEVKLQWVRLVDTKINAHSTYSTRHEFDIAIVGGGIIGLATAQELIFRHPELNIVVAEKESMLGFHQTSHNSGVIHAGIYYKPGSIMAQLCVRGLESTYKYCDKYGIEYKKCGKLIVATNDIEVKRLDNLFERALVNAVPGIEMIGPARISQIEPLCVGIKALWSPNTGIVDWHKVALMYAEQFIRKGGTVMLDFEVTSILSDINESSVSVIAADGRRLVAKHVLTCGGLQSDRLAALTSCDNEPSIVPFRAHYMLLNKNVSRKISGNIYPVPDPNFPFLGVHFTPRINSDEVWVGPNALLSLSREGYSWNQVNLKDVKDILTNPGFYRLAKKYSTFGLKEMACSLFMYLSVLQLKRFVPSIRVSDLRRGPSGIRAQALNVASGELVNDFVFDSSASGRVLHVRNAPSPGATSSIEIAKMLSDRAQLQFGLPSRPNAELF